VGGLEREYRVLYAAWPVLLLEYFRKETIDEPTVVNDIDEQIMAHIHEILRLVKR
jgi:hypothetical protein